MKTMLLMLLVSLSAIAWRSPDIMQTIAAAGHAQDPAVLKIGGVAPSSSASAPRPMSAEEFDQLSKTDPQAYQKYINSFKAETQRSEVDKLMNLLAHGKYE